MKKKNSKHNTLLILLYVNYQVQDISAGCGTMYGIEIASRIFEGLPVMKQHRLVQNVLSEEIKGWHGVQLKTAIE